MTRAVEPANPIAGPRERYAASVSWGSMGRCAEMMREIVRDDIVRWFDDPSPALFRGPFLKDDLMTMKVQYWTNVLGLEQASS